jgi:hypothetical protein
MIWGWITDAVLAVLLISTLVMAIRLDRALRVVRRDRAVFEALISNLGSATNSVKLGIQALRHEADRAAEQIERRSEDADKLATDLSFLIEAADRAGARLDEARQSLATPQMPREQPPAANPPSIPTAERPAVIDQPTDRSGGERQGEGGVREFAGIAKRRRATTTAGSAQQADPASPKTNETVLPLRSQVVR